MVHLNKTKLKLLLLNATRIPGLRDAWLQNLRTLVLNRIPAPSRIRNIASGQSLPLLRHLYINVNTLRCTSFKVNDNGRVLLENAYTYLTEQLRENLNVYIHGIRLDLTRPFADYHFNETLIEQHTWNRKSGLTVHPCYSVSSTNFADVLKNYKLSKNPDEATQRYDRFHELYPNVQVVKLIGWLGQHRAADLFLDFLRTCRGLTGLVIESSELVDADFYRKLASVESCRTLCTLKIATEDGAHHVDQAKVLFENCLPSFSFLRRFETNLVTNANMLQLLGNALRDGQNFVLPLDEYLIDIRQTSASEYQAMIRDKTEPYQFLMPAPVFLTLEAMLEAVRYQLGLPKPSLEPPSKRPRTA